MAFIHFRLFSTPFQGNVRLVTVEPIPVLAACLAANVQHYSVPGVTRATVRGVGPAGQRLWA